MKKKLLITAVLVIVLATAFVLGRSFYLKSKGNDVPFKTVKATRGALQAMVTATGTVNAVTTVQVGTQVSGTVKELLVDYNSVVKQGQLLARIDPALSEARVAQARANLQAAVANVEKAEAALADANRTLERNKTLYAGNYIARSDLDAAETAQVTARAQLSVAKAQVEQQKAGLNQEETSLRYTRILSPVDGVVISRSVDIGQTVAASFQTPTLFSIAQDLTRMQIDTNVDEADIGRIKVGQTVQFTVDAYPDAPFPGRVSEIRNAPTTISNVVTYTVIIRVANPDLKLKPGMTANVSIITAEERDILKVPNAALRFKWQPADGKQPASGAAATERPQEGTPLARSGGGAGRPQDGAQLARSEGGGERPPEGVRQGRGQRGAGRPQEGQPAEGEQQAPGTTIAGRPQEGQPAEGVRQGRGQRGAGRPQEGAPQARGAGRQGETPAGEASPARPAAAGPSQGVWVLGGKDGKTPQRVVLKLGISDGSETAVLAGELKAGDRVIVGTNGEKKAQAQQFGGPRGPF